MFVFLKLLLFLCKPLMWCILLLAYAWRTKNAIRKRQAFRIAFAALLFFSNPFIIRQLLSAYEAPAVKLGPAQKFNAGIVLGGMVAYNAAEEQGYFNSVSDRFIETALLYKEGHLDNVIVAAGNGYLTKNNFSEAGFIKEKLVALGVPPAKIFTDGLSRNTFENAQNAKKITDTVHLTGPYLLISSAMHLPRAAKVFGKAGLNVLPYPCDFLSKETRNNFFEDYLMPSARALFHWENFIKELAGTLTYSLTGKG